MFLFDRLRRRGGRQPADDDTSRRAFFRQAAGATAGLLGAGLLLPEDAWAAVERRAAQHGIVPGTVVDARGRPIKGAPIDTPFIGTIVAFGFNFAPRDWAMCNGQLLSIAQNTALFSLLGTTYGGNGQTTFALPDLRGRVPMHHGQGPGLTNRFLGESSGAEQSTLLVSQMPGHTHTVAGSMAVASSAGTTPDPTGNIIAAPASSIPQYAAPASATGSSGPVTGTAATTGGSQPHSIMQPYLALNFCIALFGIFPSQN